MRRRAKCDDNQPLIVEAFRKLGWSVQHTHQIGQGCPDVFCAKDGHTIAVEIKDGGKPPSQRKLTTDEIRWHSEWKGDKRIVVSVSDVMNINKEFS